MPVITLTTDFGTQDWFVGTMKGVVLGIAPGATVVDITHEIPAGDIRAGAFALAASYGFFPRGTIHVVVVDPGVGSTRKAIAVQTTQHLFVGPDNGVLSLALAREKVTVIRALENERYFVQPVSRTFHGRDIFAPAAAHLARGVPIARFGEVLKTFSRLKWQEPRRQGGQVRGEVVYIDRCGNAITNIREANIASGRWEVSIEGNDNFPVKDCYQAVPLGRAVGVLGSTGFLEIAVNGGSARQVLDLKIGGPVVLNRTKRLQRVGQSF